MPFVKFKKKQAAALHRASVMLSGKRYNKLTNTELSEIAECVLNIQKENYAAKNKKTFSDLNSILGLTP